MNRILDNLLYAKTHEWVDMKENRTARAGISDFAQQELGDIVFINLPEAGDPVTAGEAFGDVESVKAVSDIVSPLTGIVSAVNREVAEHPERINESPYESWLVEIEEISGQSALMTAAEYEAFCGKEAH
ncbi:MAG: glycine cleavage system protein GcvH [Tannerella sp.]|jgi:glycine cleavage system H protein|nr:glycine cleavage system protein GcvH [Tannerella sp.]